MSCRWCDKRHHALRACTLEELKVRIMELTNQLEQAISDRDNMAAALASSEHELTDLRIRVADYEREEEPGDAKA